MLVTLTFSGVAMKSRTFSSFSHLANEQVCRSWEGPQPGRQHKLANRNIPYHGWHAQCRNGGLQGGRECSLFLFSVGSNPFLSRSLNFSRS